MIDLGFNKIAFCVLGTGLALVGLNETSGTFFRTTPHEKPGYDVPVTESLGPAVTIAAEGPRDYFRLISTADVVAGKEVSVKCQQCHKFERNALPSTGPSLFGILGRDIASVPGFKYTTGVGSMSEQKGAWTYEHLDHFLESPRKKVPGTAMNFWGLKKQQDRSNVIAYLRTLTDAKMMPLPEPLARKEP